VFWVIRVIGISLIEASTIFCIEQGKPLNSLGCLDQIIHKLGLAWHFLAHISYSANGLRSFSFGYLTGYVQVKEFYNNARITKSVNPQGLKIGINRRIWIS